VHAGRSRELLARAVLVVAGLMFALVGLEAVLQGAAAVLRWRGRDVPPALAGPERRVVCFGDSNTYGLRVEEESAYPHMIERLWNENPALPRIEVVNLGYPSKNSSALRNEFGDALRKYRPDIVTILIGVNDTWTVPEPMTAVSGAPCAVQARRFELWPWVQRHSRVYRLLALIRQPAVRFLPRGKPPPNLQKPAEKGNVRWASDLQQNLRSMVECARQNGVEPILLTYPTGWRVYGAANDELRRAAATLRTRLVDLNQVFQPLCPDASCPLLFAVPDQHPTAAGHRLAATLITAKLREVMGVR